jgi:hypothetical protein
MNGYYLLYFAMGAVRLHFQLNRDDWEYGLITIRAQIKIFVEATAVGDGQCIGYFNVEEHEAMLEAVDAGEVTLGYAQTLGFIRATDYLSRMLVESKQEAQDLFYGFVRGLTSRFDSQKDFEKYYLDYASGLLQVVKGEFDKEPRLRGKLATFLFE